ncbi:sulfurtransferase [Duganella aceris]|uniref:Sulfurtransferase n=1 Tax=Duganella aceris TaxID=2703883 RepID=A0ABX0FGN0_9BURK|nr:rhodanese-like domain-containing protein [Duganella aceris]NGZ83690.1 sulfurtransferase [Duganella aceris]
MRDFPAIADSRPDLIRGRQLVTPVALAAMIGGTPAGAWRLFEAGCGAEALFEQAHIPGAAYLDTCLVEQAPLWNKVSDDALLALLLAHGVRHDTTVILYGRNNLAAARLAHLMLYAGVSDVRLLDGGFALWRAGGHACESGPARAAGAACDFGAAFPAHPEYMTDMREVQALLARRDGALVSIRTEAEFTGKVSGYSYISAAGDIPGARWGRAGEDGDVNSMSTYHHADGSMKPAADIRRQWADAGIAGGERTVFYCGTGWRASMAFFYAWLMGWNDISVYDGGWCEWSRSTG